MLRGCFSSSPPGDTEGVNTKICRIMLDLQFNMAAAAEAAGAAGAGQDGGHAWPRGTGGAHGGGGGRGDGTEPRAEREGNFISFFGGVSNTRSSSGRRELRRCGFVSINYLEAGWLCALARHAAGPGDARERGGRRSGRGAFFSERWRPLGFGDGPSREEAAL